MKPILQEIACALGLDRWPVVYQDTWFLLALSAGGIFCSILWLFVPVQPIALAQVLDWKFLSLTLWQPFLEELFFRGFLQGQLYQYSWGKCEKHGLTVANLLTSLLFTAGHLWHHPPLWAMAVLFPSLVFGYFRDRYASVYPPLALHIFYNAGYFAVTGITGID